MALPKNRPAILAILNEIEARIVGQRRDGFSCGCGAVHWEAATATAIIPGGNEYPGQEISISCWTVEMRYHPEDPNNRNGYGYCLSEFIDYDELKEIFYRHFGNDQRETYEYSPKMNSSDRAVYGNDPLVCILDNESQMRFCFDWGNLQEFAKQMVKLYTGGQPRNKKDSITFKQVIEMLETINPMVYAGGPPPELSFEPNWLMDYKKAVEEAKTADHVFFQNIGGINGLESDMDIVFMKNHFG